MMLNATSLPRSAYLSLLYTVILQVVSYVGSRRVMAKIRRVIEEVILSGMATELEYPGGAVIQLQSFE
jgi:hypothetical protein